MVLTSHHNRRHWWQWLLALSLSMDWVFFSRSRSLTLDLYIRRGITYDIELVIALPWLARCTLSLVSLDVDHRKPYGVSMTGFEVTSQYLRLAWRWAKIGKLCRGKYWLGFWRDLFGQKETPPTVQLIGVGEFKCYLVHKGREVVHSVVLEAFLYEQKVRGHWVFPVTMTNRWIEIHSSHPLPTSTGSLTKYVYHNPTRQQRARPLESFHRDYLRRVPSV